MPCQNSIKSFLNEMIYNEAAPALSMSATNAKDFIDSLNRKYEEEVIIYSERGDTPDISIYVPQTLVDKYYEAELMMELAEMKKAEEDARAIQKADALRADEEYTDEYMYGNDEAPNIFTKAEMAAARDNEIATKLAEKYKQAFGIDYQILNASEAAVILQNSPTPYSMDVSAFFYNNTAYFVKGQFTAKNVLHEFAHPLIKGIAYQNPKLFNNLYSQLSASSTGQNAIQIVRERYPELQEGTDRFKEEALVTAMELDADMKLKKVKSNDSMFEKFIQNLLFALKKVIQALTKKVNLKNLDTTTTRDELVDMMLNEDFQIEDLQYQLKAFAEFKKDTDDFLKELKTVQPEQLNKVINRFHDEMAFQLNQLKISPKKLREELGKDGIDIIRNIKNYVQGYQKEASEATDEDLQKLVNALELEQQDMRLRSLALVNSLGDLDMFARRIAKIFTELRTSGAHLTEEGNQKVQYFKEFMEREVTFLKDIGKLLKLDPGNELSKKILSIKKVFEDNIDEASDMTVDFMKKFFLTVGEKMQTNVKQKLNESIDNILKAEKFTEAEIAKFKEDLYDKLDVENIKKINVNDLLPRELNAYKYLNTDIKNYQANKITEQSVDDYLRGHVRDLSMAGAIATPMGNQNDLFGAFAQFMRDKLSDSEVDTLANQIKYVEELKIYLNAVGWDPNKPSQLADMLLFVDKVGDRDENGEYQEYEVLSFIDKFKDWRADKDKLEYDLEKAKTNKDKDAIKEAMTALSNFNKNYMNRKYKDEVYEVQNVWKQDNEVYDPSTKKKIIIDKDVAMDAFIERKEALDDLLTYNSSSPFTELDDLLDFTPSDNVKTRYNELYNLYDNDGKYKQGVELEKVLVRRLHREVSRKFNESITNDQKFQQDLDHFVNVELSGKGISKDATPADYEAELAKFFNKNLRTAYTDDYYQKRTAILNEIKKINEKGEGTEVSKKLAELYEQRYNLVNKVTDKDGEPNGMELGLESIKRLKAVEEEIVSLQDSFDKKTGLSKEDASRLRAYENIIANGKSSEFTEEQRQDYNSLVANKTAFGFTPEELTYLRTKYRELSELTDTVPTDYYVTSFNKALGDLKIEELLAENADEWINSANVLEARSKNSRFAEWFDRNHYVKSVYDTTTGEYMDKYFRLKVWSLAKPSNASYYKSTKITDPSTGIERSVPGVPISKYSYTRIKPQYWTGYDSQTKQIKPIVGVEIDNHGNFLPKEYIPGQPGSAVDNKYINEKYYQLKSSNSAQFKLLEKMKSIMLRSQEDSPYSSRMYLDLPRFRIDTNLEYITSGNLQADVKDKTSAAIDGIKSWVKSASDDAERGLNFDTTQMYIRTDLQGNPISKVPVRGLYKMNTNSVSKDIIRSILTYGYSVDQQKTLIENQPIAKAYLDVLSDPANALDRMDAVSSVLAKSKDTASMFLKRGTNQRLELAKDYIDRTFYGKNVTEWEQEHPLIGKVIRGLMKNARFSFYSLNPVSTLKNKLGMDFQKIVYVSGGKHISWSSMARGTVTSAKTVLEYAATGAYAKGKKSLNLQLMDNFDMSPGKTGSDMGKSTTRTAVKDLLDAAWLYSDRKLTELQGALDIGFSLLEFQTIEQTQPDGSKKEIRYADAFETDADGVIKLKEGIDLEWGMKYIDHVIEAGDTIESIAKKYSMTPEELMSKNSLKKGQALKEGESLVISRNKKFNEIKRRIASANKKLNGSIAKIDSPIGEKYLLYDVFTFSRKFGTGMFLSRFQMDTSKDNLGGEVWDWDLDESNRGKYIQFIATAKNLITDFRTAWPLMTQEEKKTAYSVITEGMMIFFLGLAITYLFGYDPGDEDRFEKIRRRQEKYGTGGWIINHMLYQMIMVQKENRSMIPLPYFGLKDWLDFTSTSTIVIGPTLDLYSKILGDFGQILTGNEKAIYKQDVGVYSWQKEGKYKLWSHLGSIFGLSGKSALPLTENMEEGPIWAIKKAEIFENLR
jgi:hypothetical protein